MTRQGLFPVGYVFHETYRILRRLGMGGMGAVFEVEHLRLPRRLALKVMTAPVTASSEYNMRFRQEAEIAASISHSNLVSVFDWNVTPEERLPYLVMELLNGEDLAQLLKRSGALPQQVAISILAQAIAALEVVHSHGIVHRDIKPANLFLCKDSVIPHFTKVLDFGIAKSTQPNSALVTNNLVLMGTPAYMAPEQARGDLGPVGPRADQFALALVFYEMLSGRPAFYRSGEQAMTTLFRVMNEEPQPLPDPAMNAAVLRALRKRPDDRYQSLSAMLSAIVAAASVPVDEIAVPERTEKVILRSVEVPREPQSPHEALAPTPAETPALDADPGVEPAPSVAKPRPGGGSILRSVARPLPVAAREASVVRSVARAVPVLPVPVVPPSSTSPDPVEPAAGDAVPIASEQAAAQGRRAWLVWLAAPLAVLTSFVGAYAARTWPEPAQPQPAKPAAPIELTDLGVDLSSPPPDLTTASEALHDTPGTGHQPLAVPLPKTPTPVAPAPRPTRISLRIPGISTRTEAGRLIWQCVGDALGKEDRKHLLRNPLELDWGADRRLYVAVAYWKTGVSYYIESCLRSIHRDLSGIKAPILVKAVEEPLP